MNLDQIQKYLYFKMERIVPAGVISWYVSSGDIWVQLWWALSQSFSCSLNYIMMQWALDSCIFRVKMCTHRPFGSLILKKIQIAWWWKLNISVEKIYLNKFLVLIDDFFIQYRFPSSPAQAKYREYTHAWFVYLEHGISIHHMLEYGPTRRTHECLSPAIVKRAY